MINGNEHCSCSEDRASSKKESISHGFYEIRRCIAENGVRDALISTDCLTLDIITDGEGVHSFEEKSIPCKTNDMYIVAPGVPHGYFLTDTSKTLTVRSLTFRMEDWLRQEVIMAGVKRCCYGVFQDDPEVCYAMLNSRMREKTDIIIDSIESELQDREIEWKDVIRSHLVQLLCLVSRYINSSIKAAPQRAKEHDIVCEAVQLMEREFNDCGLSLDQIAKRLFVSPSRLSRIFKDYTGQLFSEHLREIRLNCAAKLLGETELTVEKIVTECGLRNVPAFYRNFRDSYDMTPQIYRQIVKTSNKEIKIQKDKDTNGENVMVTLSEISENIQKGKAKLVKELVAQAISEGASPERILNEGLLAGMNVIGEKFKNNEVYVPEVLVAARAMNMGVQILKPYLSENDVKAVGKVCIGTVQGDLHDIGKNLVRMMMEGKGLEVIDLGTDVSPEVFVKTAIEENCQIICCSALLTTTMSVMEDVVKAAETAGIREKVKIMIGGAPITEEFRQKIGADVYTVDAASAADAAVQLCRK